MKPTSCTLGSNTYFIHIAVGCVTWPLCAFARWMDGEFIDLNKTHMLAYKIIFIGCARPKIQVWIIEKASSYVKKILYKTQRAK